jgi:hypothetical protein
MTRFSGYPPEVPGIDALTVAHALHVDFLLSDSGYWCFFSRIVRTVPSEICLLLSGQIMAEAVVFVGDTIMRVHCVFRRMLLAVILVFTLTSENSRADETADSIKLLQSVEPGGKGTAIARKAVQSLALLLWPLTG